MLEFETNDGHLTFEKDWRGQMICTIWKGLFKAYTIQLGADETENLGDFLIGKNKNYGTPSNPQLLINPQTREVHFADKHLMDKMKSILKSSPYNNIREIIILGKWRINPF